MSTVFPWMGLGLSSNLSARDRPHPYRLLKSHPGLFDYVEYSAPLSLSETREEASLFAELWENRERTPVLFHPVHLNLYGPELESRDQLSHLSSHLKAVGSPWVGNDVGWWHHAGQAFPGHLYFPPPLNAEGLADCVEHALHVQGAIDVPLLLENPTLLSRRGSMHVLDFMAELHHRTGLKLLLDLGHLFSHQWLNHLPLEAGLDNFPLEEVVEIHIAGGAVNRLPERFYVDDHALPIREELFDLLEAVLPRCRNLKALTLEGDGHPEHIAALSLQRLGAILKRRFPQTSAWREPVEGAAPVATDSPAAAEKWTASSDPWGFFDAVRGASVTEGVEDLRSEIDLRLSALAQQLDLEFPLTRRLLCGGREKLLSFSASDAYRDHFSQSGKAVSAAFASFARGQLRDTPDEEVAAILSFETWALATCPRAEGEERIAEFPIDLSEAVFAAGAMERHLELRARVAGPTQEEDYDSIRQAARRAPRRPWRLVLRRKNGRAEVALP